jgi:hypothetical protein
VAGIRPPAEFAGARLEIHTVAAGERFGRIYMAKYPNPLGYGKSKSRFSDPRRRVEASRFGVLYLGQTLKVCFLEAVLRDQRDGVVGDLPMEEQELESRRYAEIEVTTSLRLVDLREDRAVVMGVSSDVYRATRHTLGQAWSVAFHEHPSSPDGIIYPSRLNGHINLAVYSRAVGKLKPVRVRRLHEVAELAPVLNDLRIDLIEPDPRDVDIA